MVNLGPRYHMSVWQQGRAGYELVLMKYEASLSQMHTAKGRTATEDKC